MKRYFNNNIVEVSGIRTISGGGTNASNAAQALLNLSGASITSLIATGAALRTYTDTQVNTCTKNLGNASGLRVMTTGEYNAITPLSGVIYLLI